MGKAASVMLVRWSTLLLRQKKGAAFLKASTFKTVLGHVDVLGQRNQIKSKVECLRKESTCQKEEEAKTSGPEDDLCEGFRKKQAEANPQNLFISFAAKCPPPSQVCFVLSRREASFSVVFIALC